MRVWAPTRPRSISDSGGVPLTLEIGPPRSTAFDTSTRNGVSPSRTRGRPSRRVRDTPRYQRSRPSRCGGFVLGDVLPGAGRAPSVAQYDTEMPMAPSSTRLDPEEPRLVVHELDEHDHRSAR